MVSFLGPFILSMCNDGMCFSSSTVLLFLIMTYDATSFQQDEKRRRKSEQNIECRQRKEEKKAQAQVRLRERNKLRLEIARQAIPVADGDEDEELSNAVVEDINVEAANNTHRYENVYTGYMG